MSSMDEQEPLLPISRQTLSPRRWPYISKGIVTLYRLTIGRFVQELQHLLTKKSEKITIWTVLRSTGPDGNVYLWGSLTSLVLCIIIGRALRVLLPLAYGNIVEVLSSRSSQADVWVAFAQWLILLYVDDTALSFINRIAISDLQDHMQRKLQTAAHLHAMSLSADFHDKNSPSDVSFRIRSGASVRYLFDAVVLRLIPTLIDLIIGSVVSWLRLGVAAFTIGCLTSLVSLSGSILLAKRTVDSSESYYDSCREESRSMSRSLKLWYEAKASNRLQDEHQRYANRARAKEYASRAFLRSSLLMDFVSTTTRFGGLIALCVIIWRNTVAGSSTAGEFVTAYTYWNSLMTPLDSLVRSYRQILTSLKELQELAKLLRTLPTIRESPDAKTLVVRGGRVEFEDVSFSYPESQSATLTDLNLIIEPGQRVALVGSSGSGKSTIIKLLARHFDVSEGTITIDGERIQDVRLHSLHQNIGLMPQNPMLFNGTIMENVLYGRPEAKPWEVHEACRAAAIHEQILQMEHDYDTVVGNNGVKLSGGQQQRIAIARLFLKSPKIIILDEATSAMDTETEAQIQESLTKLFVGRTVLMVAHRLSTVQACDVIYVMQQGKIQEAGAHAELLRRNGQYARLWTKQAPAAETPTCGPFCKQWWK